MKGETKSQEMLTHINKMVKFIGKTGKYVIEMRNHMDCKVFIEYVSGDNYCVKDYNYSKVTYKEYIAQHCVYIWDIQKIAIIPISQMTFNKE